MRAKSIDTSALRAEYRRARQLNHWTSDYLEGERIYLTAARCHMREVETTLGGTPALTKPVHGRSRKGTAAL